MVATAHALIAGSIATSTQNPALGIAISFASHPILDAIPHWDFGVEWKKKSKVKLFWQASGDLLVGVILTYILFSASVGFWYLMAAIFAAEVWDMAEAPYWILGWKIPPFKWAYEIQSRMQNKARLPWGIITQVATVGIIFWALKIT